MSPKWKTYTCRYYHEGRWWGLDLVAENDADAEARVCKLGNLQLLGEIKAQFRASTPGAGLLSRLLVTARNWLWPSR